MSRCGAVLCILSVALTNEDKKLSVGLQFVKNRLFVLVADNCLNNSIQGLPRS